MRGIDIYIDKLYKNTSMKESDYLKEEMKAHLTETARELQREGYTEEESINLAIERFGEVDEVKSELEEVVIKKPIAYLSLISLSIILAVGFFSVLIFTTYSNRTGISYNKLVFIVPIIIEYLIIRNIIFLKMKTSSQNLDIKREFLYFTAVTYIVFIIFRVITSIDYPRSEFIYNLNLIPLKSTIEDFMNFTSQEKSILPVILSVTKHIIYYIILGVLAPMAFKCFRNRNNLIILAISTVVTPLFLYYIAQILGFTIVTVIVIYFFDYLIFALIGTLIGYSVYRLIYKNF
ncbi:MAG: permease prefix domain 1-containing protein [Clostridium sp.]